MAMQPTSRHLIAPLAPRLPSLEGQFFHLSWLLCLSRSSPNPVQWFSLLLVIRLQSLRRLRYRIS